jgi:hypothetical protein
MPRSTAARKRPAWAVTISLDELKVEDVPTGEWIDFDEDEPDQGRRPYDPPSPSVNHIIPKSRGGTNDPRNLQIAHLRCNLLKHDDPVPSPAYARARLSLTLDGTPVPARVWQQEHQFRRDSRIWRGRYEVLARECDRGNVGIELWRLALRYRVWQARRRRARRQRAWAESVR